MAKKQAGLSDAMSMALIRGEREIGRAQAAKDTAGIKEIFGGIADVVTTSLQKKKKREAKLEAYAEALGGVQNINMLEDDYNKQAVTDFVRTKRDEYNEAAKMYEKTKDAKYRDQMEAVKFSFENLNAQLQGLVQEKAEYMTSFEKKELVHLEGDEKYTDIYTNNSKFSIEQNGDVGFATGTFKDGTSKYHKLKDIAGKWNTKQYDTELLVLQNNDTAFKIAQQGKDFPRDSIKNNYNSTLKQSGPKGIRVMSKTDISGEDQYENLPDDLSFEALWQTGGLLPKFYKNFKAKDGVKWMDDPDNAPMLSDMLSEYLTDVNHYTHRENFKAKREATEGRRTSDTKEKGRNLTNYGYRTYEQMDEDYDYIKEGDTGDTITVKLGGKTTSLIRSKAGYWVNKFGDSEKIYTRNQVKAMRELNHLPNYEKADLSFLQFNANE